MKRISIPCPFCGKSVALVGSLSDLSEGEDLSEYDRNHYSVVCDYNEGGCGASVGQFYESELDAISAFIGRANLAQITKTAEEVLKEAKPAIVKSGWSF